MLATSELQRPCAACDCNNESPSREEQQSPDLQTGDRAAWTVVMQDGPCRQKSAHLSLQLRGSPLAAHGHCSFSLQHVLQGGTHRPADSHQQHRLSTCATQGKWFSLPAQALAPGSARPHSWSI